MISSTNSTKFWRTTSTKFFNFKIMGERKLYIPDLYRYRCEVMCLIGGIAKPGQRRRT